jgi:hypothetical protein
LFTYDPTCGQCHYAVTHGCACHELRYSWTIETLCTKAVRTFCCRTASWPACRHMRSFLGGAAVPHVLHLDLDDRGVKQASQYACLAVEHLGSSSHQLLLLAVFSELHRYSDLFSALCFDWFRDLRIRRLVPNRQQAPILSRWLAAQQVGIPSAITYGTTTPVGPSPNEGSAKKTPSSREFDVHCSIVCPAGSRTSCIRSNFPADQQPSCCRGSMHSGKPVPLPTLSLKKEKAPIGAMPNGA